MTMKKLLVRVDVSGSISFPTTYATTVSGESFTSHFAEIAKAVGSSFLAHFHAKVCSVKWSHRLYKDCNRVSCLVSFLFP